MDIYEPPKTDLHTDPTLESYRELIDQQRPILAGFISFVIPNVMLPIMTIQNGLVPGFIFFIPAIVTGVLVKFLGRPIKEKTKLTSALICSLSIALLMNHKGVNLLSILIPLISFGICYAISERNLSRDQRKIVYAHKRYHRQKNKR